MIPLGFNFCSPRTSPTNNPMQSADLHVLDAAVAWLEAGHRVVLVTVARTWGSSPRPVGAWAAIRADGLIAGSVSGGCVEDDLVRRVKEGLGSCPQVLDYGVSREDAARFGLPCGGTLQLVLEPQPDAALLQELQRRCRAGQITLRRLDVASGAVELADGCMETATTWDGQCLAAVRGPHGRLLIIGAGQVSAFLAPMVIALGYEVTICDPREEYYRAWSVTGTRLLTDMPDDVVLAFRPDGNTAIVALTHDPKLDDLALLEALRSAAFYVGALGSRATTAKRKERLGTHFGLSEAELGRLHGPVGLPIGSRTPAEIAVSIAADLVAEKHRLCNEGAPAVTSACA